MLIVDSKLYITRCRNILQRICECNPLETIKVELFGRSFGRYEIESPKVDVNVFGVRLNCTYSMTQLQFAKQYALYGSDVRSENWEVFYQEIRNESIKKITQLIGEKQVFAINCNLSSSSDNSVDMFISDVWNVVVQSVVGISPFASDPLLTLNIFVWVNLRGQ